MWVMINKGMEEIARHGTQIVKTRKWQIGNESNETLK